MQRKDNVWEFRLRGEQVIQKKETEERYVMVLPGKLSGKTSKDKGQITGAKIFIQAKLQKRIKDILCLWPDFYHHI